MKEAHCHYATLPLLLVVPTRIELVMVDYQSTVIPFNYRTMVVPVGIEPTSTDLQTAAMTTSAKAPKILVVDLGFEPSRCSPSDHSPEFINLSRTPVLSTVGLDVRTRTATNDFGDRHAAITSHRGKTWSG
jgi:hypothetical protein